MNRTLVFAGCLAGLVIAQSAFAQESKLDAAKWQTQEKAGQWRATKLKGLNVYNKGNEKIGDIADLLVNTKGEIEAVVIGAGGFLGMGEHDVAVPFSELKFEDRADRTANNAAPANAPAKPAGETTATVNKSTNPATNIEEYPDRAVLDMTKDQLKAAPQFKFAKR